MGNGFPVHEAIFHDMVESRSFDESRRRFVEKDFFDISQPEFFRALAVSVDA